MRIRRIIINKQIFVTLTTPGKPVLDALMLAASIRRFGGDWTDCPIWILTPNSFGQLSPDEQAQFSDLKADVFPYELESEILQFPFAAKIGAAAVAENMARGQTERLTWLDSDTLIIQEPGEFILPSGKALGYRPVHHRLIGPAWDEPLDPFWQLIYQHCRVPEGRNFPMKTHVGEKTRPYFNAGSFVVRPERGLLSQWLETFQNCYRLPEFTAYYKTDGRYPIFMHQAIFTGVLLHGLLPEEMQQLGPSINYPLHLHYDIPTGLRPETINELVTLRHETIFDDPAWREKFPIAEPLKSWLETQPRIQNRP